MPGFYVYLHRREDTKEVFYVGKGAGKRAYNFKKRNPYWLNVYRKYGCVVEIVADGLTEEEALKLECDLIRKYGRTSLTNLTDGGEGSTNSAQTKEKKDEIREFVNKHKRLPFPQAEDEKTLYWWLSRYCSPSTSSFDPAFRSWARLQGYSSDLGGQKQNVVKIKTKLYRFYDDYGRLPTRERTGERWLFRCMVALCDPLHDVYDSKFHEWAISIGVL